MTATITEPAGTAAGDPAEGPAESSAALDALVAEHSRSLLAYIDSLVNDHYLAEDIVQETLIRAWRHSATLSPAKGSVHGWLLTVGRNLAIDRIRSASSRHERVGIDDRPEPRFAVAARAQPDHADEVAAGFDTVELLRGLSPEHRDVIRHTCLAGMTAKETALALGIPVGTVKSRRHYALSLLRRRMNLAA